MIGVIGIATISIVFPSFPSLTVNFKITSGSSPTLTVTQSSYARVSIVSTIGLPLGRVTLTTIAANRTVTPYSIAVSVQYGNDDVSGLVPFNSLGEGTYQIHVVYSPRSEDPNTPYGVTIVFNNAAFQIVTIYPK